jgi:hypothetical protein
MEQAEKTGWLRGHRWHFLAGVLALALIVAAYFVGKGSVDTHTDQLSSLESDLASSEQALEAEEAEVSAEEGEHVQAIEKLEMAEEALAAERGFNDRGGLQKQQVEQEYATDYPWGAAGLAGDFTFKPIGWEQEGESWVLTVEAKNESHGPKEPFCGGAEAVVLDADQNEYTGEAVLGEGSANCGSALQPGTTATYKGEFNMAANAVPVVVGIYGEYEQEDAAKTWELPH